MLAVASDAAVVKFPAQVLTCHVRLAGGPATIGVALCSDERWCGEWSSSRLLGPLPLHHPKRAVDSQPQAGPVDTRAGKDLAGAEQNDFDG